MIADTWGHGVMRWHANKWPALRNSGDCTDAHSNRMANAGAPRALPRRGL